MKLEKVVEKLENFAPLSFAESWDNVGLLIQPDDSKDGIKKIFLCNDLSESTVQEAVENCPKGNLRFSAQDSN